MIVKMDIALALVRKAMLDWMVIPDSSSRMHIAIADGLFICVWKCFMSRDQRHAWMCMCERKHALLLCMGIYIVECSIHFA